MSLHLFRGEEKSKLPKYFPPFYRVDIHNSIYNDRRGPPCKESRRDVAHPTNYELFYRLDLKGKMKATLKNPKSNKFTKRSKRVVLSSETTTSHEKLFVSIHLTLTEENHDHKTLRHPETDPIDPS